MLDYPGAYEVGITTVETAPTTANDFGVMASIFYPADSSYSRQAPKAKWLHGPSKFYAVGYGTYARLPPWFSKTVLSWTLSQVQMPARAEAPFITTKEQPFKSPVVIFCHGLAGNSTTYSTFCGSLASRGFVVLSIEHRDGSASVTAKNNYSEPIQYIPPPANDSNAERKFRQGQLVQRVHEVNEAHSLLQALNNGETIQNLLNHALPNFKNRLDIENSILIGHSFGAVTALAALQQPNHPFITGITFDPWMWPLPSHEPAIRIPMLSMQAQKFHWKDNVDRLRDLWFNPACDKDNQMAVMLKAGHQEISDIPSLLYKGVLKWLLRKQVEIPPHVVFETFDAVVGGFLKRVLKGKSDILEKAEFDEVSPDVLVSGKEAWDVLDNIEKIKY